jgi:hypothetical protein
MAAALRHNLGGSNAADINDVLRLAASSRLSNTTNPTDRGFSVALANRAGGHDSTAVQAPHETEQDCTNSGDMHEFLAPDDSCDLGA